MADTEQLNVRVLPETKRRVSYLSKKTYRSKGAVIDWIVDEIYKRHVDVQEVVVSDAAAVQAAK